MSAEFLIGLPGKIKTLLNRLTATRAANLDNLNATVASRAAASTALSNATWTNALAAQILANLDQPVSTPASPIKSIQRGSVFFSQGETEEIVNVSDVDEAKTMLIMNNSGWTQWGSNDVYGYVTTNGGQQQIIFRRQSVGASGETSSVRWELVEFN